MYQRPIGGFFGITPPPPRAGSYLQLWNAIDRRGAFRNARSAFRALLEIVPDGNVWLPAYICHEMADAVPADRLRFYPVGRQLHPIMAGCAPDMRAGDVLLAVNYFGAPPPPSFLNFVADRPDLTVVEDCAQAPDPAMSGWGDWRLYSARKIVGVPDGGLIVPVSARAEEAFVRFSPKQPAIDDALAISAPALARFEDEGEAENALWHGMSRRRESLETVSGQAISRLSWSLLHSLDARSEIERRRSNFATLAVRLASLSRNADARPSHAPFGFPIEVEAPTRRALLARLFARRIFPAVHWEELPSPAAEFPEEHALARRILTLPCDQRYDEADMDRLADAVLAATA